MKLYLYASVICCAALLSGCTSVPMFVADSNSSETAQSSAAAETDAESDENSAGNTAEDSIAENNEKNELFTFSDLKSFTAKTVDGDSVSEEVLASADVTALNIWSTSCGPCVREMPELAEYAAALPENLQLMTWCLDADYNPEPGAVKSFLDECGFSGVTLISGTGDLDTLHKQLLYTPTTIFLDSEGNQVAQPLIGAGNIKERYDAQFRAALQSLGIDPTV